MQTMSSRSLPTFLNMCGVFGPTTAMSPGKSRTGTTPAGSAEKTCYHG